MTQPQAHTSIETSHVHVPLGQLLIGKGIIGTEDLERALELQRERGDKLGQDPGRHGLSCPARSAGRAFRTTGPAARRHRRAAVRRAGTGRHAGALPAAVAACFRWQVDDGVLHAGDGRSAGFRDHQRGPRLYQAGSVAAAGGRAGDPGRDRALLQRRRPAVRGRPISRRATKRIWNICGTWRAKRRSSAW